MSDSPHVFNTNDETFELDVIERSRTVPVVVDFWADWCQPCRMLAPILEAEAESRNGAFALVKADTEQNQRAASEFNVSGIPAVFALIDGEVVDFFNGVMPAPQVATWIDGLLMRGRLLQARELESSDAIAAEKLYRELGNELPNEPAAQIGLARSLLAQDKSDEASAIIEQLEDRGFLEPEAEKLKAQLKLSSQPAVDLEALRTSITDNPKDYSARLELAEGLAGAGEYEEALQTALSVVQEDRATSGDRGRQIMVDVFRLLPEDSELTSVYRRKLATALY